MTVDDALLDLSRAVGRIEADVAAIKADVAELREFPSIKRANDWRLWGGIISVAGLLLAACKLLVSR